MRLGHSSCPLHPPLRMARACATARTLRANRGGQAAKQHYCINKAVAKTGRVDEECERLHKEESFGCKYHKGKNRGGRVSSVSVQVRACVDAVGGRACGDGVELPCWPPSS